MITVILVRPETPGNIGFIARAMANFGLEKLILVEPLCNHLEDDALKKSMHAKKILENATIKKYSYLKGIKKDFDIVAGTTSVMGDDYNVPRTPITPEQLAKKMTKKKIAIVFGNEGTGLNNKEIGICDFVVAIPSSKKYPALNISHAAAIIFYEMFKEQDNIISHIKPASRREKEVIMGNIGEILDNIEFATKEKKQTQKLVWKSVFNKSMMSKREAFSVIGLLRKIKLKINRR